MDHELAGALWASGDHDTRNLAAKIADPASRRGPASPASRRMARYKDLAAQLTPG